MKKLLIIGAILCFVMPIYGKDLSGRFGVGSELLTVPSGAGLNAGHGNWNAVSLRTYLNPQMGLGGTVGMSIDGDATLGLGANFFYVLASEANVNLLAKVGFNLGLDGDEVFSFPVVLDAEFFIDKMSNLGIDLGVGLLHLDIIGDDAVFYIGTSSLAPSLGFHYYF